jgi:hypothetical protein
MAVAPIRGPLPVSFAGGDLLNTPDPAASYQRSFNNYTLLNAQMYENQMAGYQQAMAQQSSVNDLISAGYPELAQQVAQQTAGTNQAAVTAIQNQFAQNAAGSVQKNPSVMSNTTVGKSVQTGNLLNESQALAQNAQQFAQLQAQQQSQLGLAGLAQRSQANQQYTNLAQAQLKMMNDVTASPPNPAPFERKQMQRGAAWQAALNARQMQMPWKGNMGQGGGQPQPQGRKGGQGGGGGQPPQQAVDPVAAQANAIANANPQGMQAGQAQGAKWQNNGGQMGGGRVNPYTQPGVDYPAPSGVDEMNAGGSGSGGYTQPGVDYPAPSGGGLNFSGDQGWLYSNPGVDYPAPSGSGEGFQLQGGGSNGHLPPWMSTPPSQTPPQSLGGNSTDPPVGGTSTPPDSTTPPQSPQSISAPDPYAAWGGQAAYNAYQTALQGQQTGAAQQQQWASQSDPSQSYSQGQGGGVWTQPYTGNQYGYSQYYGGGGDSASPDYSGADYSNSDYGSYA